MLPPKELQIFKDVWYLRTGSKKVNDGSPHAVDLIEKKIQLIINTTSGVKSNGDSFSIRRSAIRNKIHILQQFNETKVVTGLNLIKN